MYTECDMTDMMIKAPWCYECCAVHLFLVIISLSGRFWQVLLSDN